MIEGFLHTGLKRFFETGSRAGINPQHAGKLRLILGRLNAAADPRDMSLPGLDLHALSGRNKGRWSVSVSGNWRVTFTFAGNNADKVDYEDYH